MTFPEAQEYISSFFNFELSEPSGSFSPRRAHPEERSDEGSLEILPRFARQDEGSNVGKNISTPQLSEPSGSFSPRRAHPEERSDEGSLEILPRFARQDEGSNVGKNISTPQLSPASYSDPCVFKLDCVRYLLELLGNPQDQLKIIHVAGSKGKGSTCALTASVLRAAGYKVGLYTSPHLNDYRERIRVLDPSLSGDGNDENIFPDMISEQELCAVLEAIKPCIARLQKETALGE